MAEDTPQQLEYGWHQLYDNKVAACYGVASLMAFLASVAVLLRLLCRRRLRLELSYDDYLLILSLVREIIFLVFSHRVSSSLTHCSL